MAATGASILADAFNGIQLWGELFEVPLMAAMFVAMVWHARRRQAALEADLRPMAHALWVAIGVDPVSGRREEGVAVGGVPEAQILALGARYRQAAVFVWTPECWDIVACSGGRRVTSGWSLEEAEAGHRPSPP